MRTELVTRFLYVDLNPDFLKLVPAYIRKELHLGCVTANSVNQAMDLLKTGQKFDVVICEYELPQDGSVILYRHVLETTTASLFVLFTSVDHVPKERFQGQRFLGVAQKTNIHALVEALIKGLTGIT